LNLNIHGYALKEISEVLHKKSKLMINLRPGLSINKKLSSRLFTPLITTQAMISVCLFIIGLGFQIRSQLLLDKASSIRSDSEIMFKQLFPGEAAPTSLSLRIENKLAELKVSTNNGKQKLPDSEMPLLNFVKLLDNLPQKIRFCIQDLRLNANEIFLTGTARTHSDAEKISVSLRESKYFDVDPPKTENLKNQGVSFTIKIRPKRSIET